MNNLKIIKKNSDIKLYKFLKVVFFLLILGLIFILRFNVLIKSNHPNGLDGYYYALQAKSFMINNSLENPDYEIGYYLCGIFSKIFKDPILACKLFSSLASTLLCFSIFYFLLTITNNIFISFVGLFISGFCSPSLVSFEINYINNITGLFFFFIFASFFYNLIKYYKFLSIRKKIFLIFYTILFFTLTSLSHLVSFAYSLIFIAIIIVKKFSLKKQIYLLIFFSISFILIFIPQKERFISVFSFSPILPIFSKNLKNILGFSICFEISFYFILSYIFSFFYVFLNKKFDIFILLPLIINFPFWSLNTTGMGYRMLLNGLPCSICFILIVINSINFNFLNKINSNFLKKIYIILFILIFISPFIIKAHNIYNPKNDPPYNYYKSIVSKIDLPEDSLLIAHLGLNHVYTYYNNLKDCLNYNCDFEVPNNEIWRLAYGTNSEYLKCFFGEYEDAQLEKLIIQIDSNYVLIKEDLWQRYLTYEEDEIVNNLNNWYNPHEYRPSFIRKKE